MPMITLDPKVDAHVFVQQLRQLLNTIVSFPSTSVSPSRKLADITLKRFSKEELGGQQDIHGQCINVECMDAITDMLETFYLSGGNVESLKRLNELT